ncbi:MAG: ketopantoate reductase family protein, partial [Candidatus Binatia bacterium]
MSTRVLVAGAGALGSMYGGFLRRAGHDVALVGRRPHLDAIARGGLAIEGIFGDHVATGFELAEEPRALGGRFDLVIVAVKSYAVAAMAPVIAPLLADDGAVLSLQNGLGNLESIAESVGRERVLGAPVLIGATIPEPGRVRVTVYAKPVKAGPAWAEGSFASAQRVAALLDAAGVPSEATERLFPFLWEKMLYNAPLNALGAILGLPYGALAERSDSRAVMDDVIAEGFAVARAEGAELLWPTVEECRRHFYERLLPPTAGHRSSMLQDIERGRPTEIDALNGYIARRG